MSAPITPTIVTPPTPPTRASAAATAEQMTALIGLVAAADPAIVALPVGKTWNDVKRLSAVKHPSGAGTVDLIF